MQKLPRTLVFSCTFVLVHLSSCAPELPFYLIYHITMLVSQCNICVLGAVEDIQEEVSG